MAAVVDAMDEIGQMKWQDVVSIGLSFPGVEESISYGEPSLKFKKSLITRWRVKDNSVVLLGVDLYERDRLLVDEPKVYFLEPHYQGHQIVLARLSAVAPSAVEMFVERRWCNLAPKKLKMDRGQR